MADNFDNYGMKVQATASVKMPSVREINKQINALEESIKELRISGKFDESALKNLTNQLNSLKATVSTANFSPTALSELTSQVEKALGNIKISGKIGRELGSDITKGMQQNIDSGVVADIKKISDASTSVVVQNEKKKQDAYKATTETVMYHAGVISKLNKAETNGRFYGSNRGTGYFGTGHYFVDSATKHELDNNSSYSQMPYTSIDISKYDNLFKASTDEIANRLHSFLENLTKFTQGSDTYDVSELFSQFKKVFGETVMDMQEFDAKLEQLKSFMQNSNMSDRSDSVSTQFMKSLGYGGVDTRGTRYADTRYGTVIYDLKEESILQANITDELQKQGQMLEKINYEKGQVFDQSEDTRIQGILDQQAKSEEIDAEFGKLFDSSKIKQYESELDSVNETLKKNDEIIADCQSGIENADREAQKFAKDMAAFGIDTSDEEIAEQADHYRTTFQERIDELQKERPLLEARRQELEENLSTEYKLANTAREQARQIVEERSKEAQESTSTTNTIVQNEEKKQQAVQETVNTTKETLSEEEKLADAMGKVREKSELARQAQEKRQEVAQSKAINKALDDEYKQKQKLIEQEEKLAQAQAKEVNKIQLSIETGGYESKVDSLIGKTQQWVDANGNARISTDSLQTAMNNLNTAYANITATGGNTVANQQALIEAERALDSEVKKVQNSVNSMNATMAKNTAVDSLRQKVQQFYDINTASHRQYGAQLQSIMSQLASGTEVPITKLRQLSQEFIGIQNSARQAGKLGLSFFDTLKQGMKSFSYWTSSTFLVMKAIQEVRQVITNVKELDNAMMDLTMATGYNKNQVEELMDTYFKLGEELSATATDVAASADTWLRQGKSIAETNELIKDSMILSKISGLSAEESTKYLTSAMKGYKVATEDVLGVVDKLSAVDMASATDVGGLAEGMSQVAASADLAGVSIDKLLGYLAIVGETTQSGMSEVGTSFNAIFSRMGNIKLARLKDYQNNGEDLSNVETVLRGEGIVLRDSVNEFRNFGEVLDEVAGRWTSFSEVSQRAIASAFAGTHHMNEFIILMENYGKAVEYSEISMESSGQAMEKFAAYEDTIAAHTEKFKNSYQEMANELLDSSVVKAFVDLGTGATKLIKGLGLLGSVGLGAGIKLFIRNLDYQKVLKFCQ